MSGITPLLDTLLHQVLGKRVDTPAPRDLNQPVKPTSPADAPRALHSDSRLDARPGAAQAPQARRAPQQVDQAATPPPRQEGGPPSSSQLHLTSAGRTIADLLRRFPAPPSILTTPTPLVATSQAHDPAQVASRLESSVRDSGLFYESHLARWYRGELPRQQLEREPQMWRTLRASPPPPPAAPLAQQAHSSADEAVAGRPTTTPPQPVVPESLQGVVRHQLELLVTPTLRWEGDVWSGLFMALLIQPPSDERPAREGDQHESGDEDTRRTWRSDIDLELHGAGRITASVRMQATRLAIEMRVADPAALARLQEGLDALRARLTAHGFAEVGITLERLATEGRRADP